MSWPDHRCTAYCHPDEGLQCEAIRFWFEGAVPAREPTPGDYVNDLRRRHGVALVHWEPASAAPPIRPEEVPIGKITGQPMRRVRDWLV